MAKQTASQRIVELHAPHPGRFAFRHAGDRRADRWCNAACGAAWAAVHRHGTQSRIVDRLAVSRSGCWLCASDGRFRPKAEGRCVGKAAGATPHPGPARRASAPCRLQSRADAVAARHGAGATTGVWARDSAACANTSSCPAQPPDTPACRSIARCREARAPTDRTPRTLRRGRRCPVRAISGAPRRRAPDTNSPVDCLCLASGWATGPARPARPARGSVRAAHFVIILAATVRTQRPQGAQ